MKKNVLLIFLSFIFLSSIRAQVNMNVQVPPTGVIQKGQLWNLLLVNTSDNIITVNIQLSLVLINDNTPVLTATSKPITLTKGAKQIMMRDVVPDYKYLSSIFSDRSPEGFLPVGNFMACYVINDLAKQNELAEDCVPVEVSPVAPPQLNLPGDKTVIESPYPQFTWLPPSPLQQFNNLTYDLLLVEVRPGQSATEAIQQNIPQFNVANEKSIFSNYPASYKSLDTAKEYAWRIVAKNNGEFAAQSEVWTFKISSKIFQPLVPKNGNYILIKAGQSAGVNTVEGDILGIKYYSYDRDHETLISFYDANGALVQEIKQKLAYGDNYLAYRLNRNFKKETIYLIQLTDLQGNKSTGYFRIQP